MLAQQISTLGLHEDAQAYLVDALRLWKILPGEPEMAEADWIGLRWRTPINTLQSVFLIARAEPPYMAINAPVLDEEGVVNLGIQDARGRVFLLRVGFGEGQAIRFSSCSRPVPEGVEIKPARAEDYPLLVALERESPILQGEDVYQISRPNLADLIALQGGGHLWVAWRNARPVSLRGFAVKTVRIDGDHRRAALSQFAVVHPDERGHNFMAVFARHQRELINPTVDVVLAHIDEGNAAVFAAFVGPARRNVWSRKVYMLQFECVPTDVTARHAAAGAGDAQRIADLLNAAHGRKVLFDLQDANSIASKLSLISSYGFNEVLLADNACVGVWLSGEDIEETKQGVTSRRKLATVLDYGFDGEKGLTQLVSLIDIWCGRCAKAGITHLVLYTNAGAREAPTLIARASQVDSFLMQCSLPEPPADGPSVFTDALFI